jgi:hypothetical protein
MGFLQVLVQLLVRFASLLIRLKALSLKGVMPYFAELKLLQKTFVV